jgi:opacity protein-like surface antigen
MLKPVRLVVGALALGGAAPALAADIYEPPVVELPPAPIYETVETGGWYIRGDIDYHKSKFRGADYITYGVDVPCDPCGEPTPVPGTKSFDFGKLDASWSAGAGIGYQVNRYLRTDLTADYWFKSDFRGQTSDYDTVSTDESSMSALLLLANAYADLGTYHGVTPYVGAGIGGARVKWDSLHNAYDEVSDHHKGTSEWRFAYALMAGASYCLTSNLQADLGYRYSRIEGGRMFEEHSTDGTSIGAGPGFDKGFDTHEVRAGLRWSLGAGNPNCAPQEVAYTPEPTYEPVYK